MTFPSEFAVLLLVSFLVSFANEISHGQYLGPALLCVTFALAILAWRFFAGMRDSAIAAEGRPKLVRWLIWCAVASMPITAMCDPKILVHPHASIGVVRALEVASIPLLVTYLPFLGPKVDTPLVRSLRFAAFGAVTLAMGIAIIRISPAPGIDVWDLQMHGARALLHGENPYVTVTVPDTTPIHPYPYVPYVYAPGTLYAGAIGLIVGGDVRYAALIALLVTGASLRTVARKPSGGPGLAVPSLVEDAPALFVWLMPPLAFIIELSWTEPVQLMLVCLAVVAAVRARLLLSAATFGLAVASKQSMFWLIPLAGFALGFRARDWIAMLAAFALGVAPFALADLGALKHNTLDFLLALVARNDALCVAPWYKSTFGRVFPTAISPVAAAAVVGATTLRAWSLDPRRSSPGAERVALFGRAVALTYLAFFFFAKWAFANYYFLISGLSALAAATSLRVQPRGTGPAS